MPTIDYNLSRTDDDGNETVFELTLNYSAHRAIRGQRDSLGVPLEPDEPAGIEFDGAYDLLGEPFELSSAETERCEQACWDDYRDRERDAAEDAAERRYDEMRDRRLGL